MLEQKGGTIVNVSSITGLMGYARMSGYCATKFAVVGFTEALRDGQRPVGPDQVGVEAVLGTAVSGHRRQVRRP